MMSLRLGLRPLGSTFRNSLNSIVRAGASAVGGGDGLYYDHRIRFLTSGSTTLLKTSYKNVQVDVVDDKGVGLIRLHRPKALNALSDALFADLIHAARALDSDDKIGAMVLTGSTKAFAAGADISEMKDRDFAYTYQKARTSSLFSPCGSLEWY